MSDSHRSDGPGTPTTQVRRWIATGPADTAYSTELVLEVGELVEPGTGEVTIEVVAAGVNPADLKHTRTATSYPHPIGYEIAGRVVATGPDTEIASGPVALGDEVLAFRVYGGYADAMTVSAATVFAKPDTVGFNEAAGLLLAGSTAADLLRATHAQPGELVALHGASGAVGVAVLQLAQARGIDVIGTASAAGVDRIAHFGARTTTYGPGVSGRIRALANGRQIAASLDAAGTDEAVDSCLELTADRSRIATVAAPRRAAADGFVALGGSQPASAAFRDSVRGELISLAASGQLTVPIAATFPLAEARGALNLVASGHPGGKVILHP